MLTSQEEAGIFSILERMYQLKRNWSDHILHTDKGRLLSVLLNYKLKGRRESGTSGNRWTDDLQDMSSYQWNELWIELMLIYKTTWKRNGLWSSNLVCRWWWCSSMILASAFSVIKCGQLSFLYIQRSLYKINQSQSGHSGEQWMPILSIIM